MLRVNNLIYDRRMTKYVALLRGIGPGNPNMHNEKLRSVIEGLGMTDVQSVISSGNIVFASPRRSTVSLEKTIEEAWPQELGFSSTTIVRSLGQIRDLIDSNPFNSREDTPKARLQVTFVKNIPDRTQTYQDENGLFEILGYHDGAVFSVYDSTSLKTPKLMQWLEKQYGKQITTRTWQTVQRIATRLGS